jgi:AcrR family transcriptional regulator
MRKQTSEYRISTEENTTGAPPLTGETALDASAHRTQEAAVSSPVESQGPGPGAYAHFHAASPEKQQRILEAALEEFAARDYASASTNTIVARAQISKGLLFHYFNDKLGLYLYLLDYVARELYSDVMGHIDLANDDIFDLTQKTIEAKLEVANRSLLETRLYLRALTGDIPLEAKELLEQSVAQAYDTFALMTSLLNDDYLKEGLDREKVIQIIHWVGEGITNQLLAATTLETEEDTYAHMLSYTAGYFDFLRRLFYKEGEPGATEKGDQHDDHS